MREPVRRTALLIAACALLALPAVAFGQNPHFVRGPDYTATTSELTATGKAAGLGTEVTSAFLSADRVDVYFRCVNRGNNFAPGHPASSTSVAGPTQNIAPRNGAITFNVSLPASAPSARDVCPSRQWRVVVDRVDYIGVVLHLRQNGTDVLTDGPNTFSAP